MSLIRRLASLLRNRADVVTLGAQGLIVDADKRVLLIRHRYRPGWHFPGGGVEYGEQIEDALVREVLEETGVVVVGTPGLVGIYSHFDEFPGDHIVLFKIDRWRRDAIPLANAEIAQQGFFALDALPEGLSPGTSRRLDEIFGGAQQSSAW